MLSPTSEQINALKKLIQIVWHDSVEIQEKNLKELERTLIEDKEWLSCDAVNNFEDFIVESLNIDRYNFDYEIKSGFIDKLVKFEQKHGISLHLDKFTDDEELLCEDDDYTALDDFNEVFEVVGYYLGQSDFCLVSWDRGQDFCQLMIIRQDDLSILFEIGELLKLNFSHYN